MTVLSIPLFAFFTVLTVLVMAAGLRRLMGMTLSPLRTVIAALIAFFAASPIITAMAGAAVSSKDPGMGCAARGGWPAGRAATSDQLSEA